MSRFNTSTNHPLIPNANEYMFDRQFVSIHSEDRDITKYPSSSEFEIELPQDYCNVQAVRLDSWSFPANYNTFSIVQNNISISFKITLPYYPTNSDTFLIAVYNALIYNLDNEYLAIIEEGFYNPFQMAKELTNAMNDSVYDVILDYFKINTPGLVIELQNKKYNQFVIAYNEVSQKLWFGNKSSGFIIENTSSLYNVNASKDLLCIKQYPDFSNWGLPAYLGFIKCINGNAVTETQILPKFSYGDYQPGDGGYWLVQDPDYFGGNVFYLEAPLKINLMGNAYFYLEIDGMNIIDETMPYTKSKFTTSTNETNGIVKSAFAKIAVPTTPFGQWYDNNSSSIKLYNPPAERIRKIKVKLRYHNGILVNFGNFDYSIMLEFTLFRPQNLREYKMYIPESVKNLL